MIKRLTQAIKVLLGTYGITRWKDGMFQFKYPQDLSKPWASFDRSLSTKYPGYTTKDVGVFRIKDRFHKERDGVEL